MVHVSGTDTSLTGDARQNNSFLTTAKEHNIPKEPCQNKADVQPDYKKQKNDTDNHRVSKQRVRV